MEPAPSNPLAGNPLRTRGYVMAALEACHAPLRALGDAPIDVQAKTFDAGTMRLEQFARPLWGLAAGDHAALAGCAAHLAAGVDPGNPDYWGTPCRFDQRIVELAAVGVALCLAGETLWDSLGPEAKANLSAMLHEAAAQPVHDNNWHFFPVLIALGLRQVGEPHDAAGMAAHLDAIDGFYRGDGWYSDGSVQRTDHYNGFAFHFYGLIYCRLAPEDEARCARYRERAMAFALQFFHWFADDGAALPYGRSMSYRFACVAFFGACAFAGVEVLPWGVMKGLYLRHLRWWRQLPIAREDGVLTPGFGYANAGVAEEYISPASSYWSFKAFLPLALPENHTFWAAEERPMPPRPEVQTLWQPGMVVAHEPGHSVALTGGQAPPHFRGSAEKYAKFAYSTRYAFCVERKTAAFNDCAFDSMIGLCETDGHWRMRGASEYGVTPDGIIYSRWAAWDDVMVESWIYWERPWHIRVHRIRSARALASIEGGFCPAGVAGDAASEGRRAYIETASDFSGIVDLSPQLRAARIQRCLPDTHLLHREAVLPQLIGNHGPGETLLACAVIGSPDIARCRAAWNGPPPTIQPLPLP